MSADGGSDERAVVVYDDACAFCSASARLGARVDRRHRLRFIGASRQAELRACGIDPAAVDADSILVRTPDGHTREESRAIAAILATLPVAGPPLAFLLRIARPLADPLYRFVARHRR